MPRPVLSIVGVDRDVVYFSSQWSNRAAGATSVYTVDRGALVAALDLLDAAVPNRGAGESEKAMMARILGAGAFASLESERELSALLGGILLPPLLASEIGTAFVENGSEPILVKLMPSALSARAPWELFPVPVPDGTGGTTTRRLIEVADIVQEVPAGIHAGRSRRPAAWSDDAATALYVIDPSNQTRVGHVLDSQGHDAFRARAAALGHQASRVNDKFDRKDLHRALTSFPPPQRFVYVGHVVMSEDNPGATSFLLSDGADMFGLTAVFDQTSRPLSALDLLEGTMNSQRRLQDIQESEKGMSRDRIQWPAVRGARQIGAEIWPMPPRLTLVACNSGTDLGNPEPFGLALALINAGAEIVTATKWTLPTDLAFSDFGGAVSSPLLEAALALDVAHAKADPVGAISEWQRGCLSEWESAASSIASSPLLWASFSTYEGTAREVEIIRHDHGTEEQA